MARTGIIDPDIGPEFGLYGTSRIPHRSSGHVRTRAAA